MMGVIGGCVSSRKTLIDRPSASSGGSGGVDVERDGDTPQGQGDRDATAGDPGMEDASELTDQLDPTDASGMPDTLDAAHASAMDYEACRGSCEVTASVGCAARSSSCIATCEAVLGSSRCPAELRAYLLCQTTAGPTAFICIPNVGPSLMPGICSAEIGRLACPPDAGR